MLIKMIVFIRYHGMNPTWFFVLMSDKKIKVKTVSIMINRYIFRIEFYTKAAFLLPFALLLCILNENLFGEKLLARVFFVVAIIVHCKHIWRAQFICMKHFIFLTVTMAQSFRYIIVCFFFFGRVGECEVISVKYTK